MRRCIQWLTNWFSNWVKKMRWEEKAGFAIGGILGITAGILLFLYIDKVPATPQDYLQLESYVIETQHNPNLLFETECNMRNNGETIYVCFENKECQVNATYNHNFELLSTSNNDKSTFWLWALLVSILLGVCVYAFGSFTMLILLLIFGCLVECMINKFKR